MSGTKLYLFGAPRLGEDAAGVRIGRRKALALLAYLALSPTPQSRDLLAALLWPEATPSHAYACLRNALWTLRRTPVAEAMAVDRSTAGIVADALWVDVLRFRTLLTGVQRHEHTVPGLCRTCAAALREATALRTAAFLQGFSLPDSGSFDNWMLAEQRALDQEAADAYAHLTAYDAQRGDLKAAIASAEARLRIDPLNEAAHRELIRLHDRSGERDRAIQQFERLAQRLEEELGLAPSAETVAMVERIRGRGAEPGFPQRRVEPPTYELPEVGSPFVGREAELRVIRRHLVNGTCRLLTLVGLGGSGKTRLALRAARELADAFPDGVPFVSLGSVGRAPFALSAIADALRLPSLRQEPEEDLAGRVIASLATRRLLLVLDGLQGNVSDLSLIPLLLAGAPQVRLLVTSRDPLAVPAEHVLEVHGLATPSEDADHDELAASPAVQLFVTAAHRADARFTPTKEEFVAIGEVTRLVDGLPLALELAASWVRTVPCARIAAHIVDGMDFLTSVQRDVVPRHRDLRAVFDEGWGQLSRRSRLILRRLSVFRSAFSQRAAHHVAAAELSDLAQLVGRSFVRRIGPDRFVVHELVRQFAAERLDGAARERDETLRRHAEYFLDELAGLGERMKGAEQREALDAVRDLLAEVRAAWEWACSAGAAAPLSASCRALFFYYDMRTRFDEGAEMFRLAVDAAQPPKGEPFDDVLRAVLSAKLAWFLSNADPVRSVRLFADALEMCGATTIDDHTAFVFLLASFAGRWSDAREGEKLLGKALEWFRAQGDDWAAALALEAMAWLVRDRDPAAVGALYEESLVLRRQIGDRWGMALALTGLGYTELQRGSLPLAERRFDEALRLYRTIGEDIYGVVDCLAVLGWISHRLGRVEEAAERGETALKLSREVGNPYRVGRCLLLLGMAAHDRGDHATCRTRVVEAQPLLEREGDRLSAAHCAVLYGNVLLAAGDHDAARGRFEESLEICGGFPLGRIGLARLAAARGEAAIRDDHAAAALRGALASDPFHVVASIALVAAEWVADAEPVLVAEIARRIRSSRRGDRWTEAGADALLSRLGEAAATDVEAADGDEGLRPAIERLVALLAGA